MVDPTGHCGFPLGPQLELLLSISEAVPEMEFILVSNKTDLKIPDGVDTGDIEKTIAILGKRCLDHLELSASSGEGLEGLRRMITSTLMKEEEKPWENFK
jgi:GTP1/Obg family GTP-binding protein